MELKERLVNVARAKGICAEGYRQMLGSADAGVMVDYYVANPDWCLERDFPDLQTLTGSFSDCEDKGVFVNKRFHGEVLNERQAYIFHNCSGTVKVGLNAEKAIIPMVYLANGCRMRIVGVKDGEGRSDKSGRVRVPVYVFGKNDYSARGNRYVEFVIYNESVMG